MSQAFSHALTLTNEEIMKRMLKKEGYGKILKSQTNLLCKYVDIGLQGSWIFFVHMYEMIMF